jgi:hypothetical protein
MFTRLKSAQPGKPGAHEAKDFARKLEQQVETVTRRRIADITTTFEALTPGWEDRLENGAAFVREAAAVLHAIRTVRKYGLPREEPTLSIQVSSLFLKDCHAVLTADPRGHERLHLVSGTVSDQGVRVLSRIIEVEADESSAAYVRAAPADTHKKIIQLVERDGHELHAMFHSHIMRGAASTRPSGVDLANQGRFVEIGWTDVIGGIFSLDGYVRLFSTARDFSLSLYGNGVDIQSDSPREKILKLAIQES